MLPPRRVSYFGSGFNVASLPILGDFSQQRTLIIGFELHENASFAALRTYLPKARVINLSDSAPSENELVEPSFQETRVRRSAFAAIKNVWRRDWDVIVAVQPYSNLLLFLSLIPARVRVTLKGGSLEPIKAQEVIQKRVYRTLEQFTPANLLNPRLPAPVGRANDYRFIERQVEHHKATQQRTVSIIIPTLVSQDTVGSFLEKLKSVAYPRSLLDIRILYQPDEKAIGDLESIFPHAHLNIHPSTHNEFASQFDELIRTSYGSVLIFLSPQSSFDSRLIKHHLKWFDGSKEPVVVMAPSCHPKSDTCLWDDHEAFLRAHFLNTSLKKTLLIESNRHQSNLSFDQEDTPDLAYRLMLKGVYFVEDSNLTKVAYTPKLKSYSKPTPRVSVYIPAYNAAGTLKRAIDSVLAQTYRDIEICICDDGSTDGTIDLLKQYRDDPRVRWVHQKNGGIAAASQGATSLCKGEFIVQLDSDDELLPTAIEALLELIESNPKLSLVYGGVRRLDPKQLIYDSGDSDWVPQPYSASRFIQTCIVSHPRMFRARDYHRTSGFDLRLKNAVDYDLYLKISERGDVSALPRVLYNYYIHGQNTSYKDRWLQFKNHYSVVQMALLRRGLRCHVKVPDTSKPRQLRIEFEGINFRHFAANSLDGLGLHRFADKLVEYSTPKSLPKRDPWGFRRKKALPLPGLNAVSRRDEIETAGKKLELIGAAPSQAHDNWVQLRSLSTLIQAGAPSSKVLVIKDKQDNRTLDNIRRMGSRNIQTIEPQSLDFKPFSHIFEKAKFDFVFGTEIPLDALLDSSILQEVARVLKVGGRLIVSGSFTWYENTVEQSEETRLYDKTKTMQVIDRCAETGLVLSEPIDFGQPPGDIAENPTKVFFILRKITE